MHVMFIYKYILSAMSILIFSSCNNSGQSNFKLDPSKPVEIGIESISNIDNDKVQINVYMVNHSPVAGIQFEITPNTFFEVDTVFGGRCESSGFSLRSNKQGRILGFSMKGDYIPESSSEDKVENILFSIFAKPIKPLDASLKVDPIIASSDAKKMDYISIPFSK